MKARIGPLLSEAPRPYKYSLTALSCVSEYVCGVRREKARVEKRGWKREEGKTGALINCDQHVGEKGESKGGKEREASDRYPLDVPSRPGCEDGEEDDLNRAYVRFSTGRCGRGSCYEVSTWVGAKGASSLHYQPTAQRDSPFPPFHHPHIVLSLSQ